MTKDEQRFVGTQPPEGYLQWHRWAEIQEKAGLRQVQCGECGKWKYPQELSDRVITSEAYKDKAMTKKVILKSPVCNKCNAPTRAAEGE